MMAAAIVALAVLPLLAPASYAWPKRGGDGYSSSGSSWSQSDSGVSRRGGWHHKGD
jgi:hypothetical protein